MKQRFHSLMQPVRSAARSVALRLTTSVSDLDDRPPDVVGTNTDYKKFVVLAYPRTGSSVLTNSLRLHPQIHCFGELFEPGQMDFYTDGFDNHSAKLLYLRNRWPIEFLDRYIFGSYRSNVQAVGFKLFPHQINTYTKIWNWLASSRDLKIVRLVRSDLLSVYVSRQLALDSGVWSIRAEEHRHERTLIVSPDDCSDYFEGMTNDIRKMQEVTKDHDVLSIEYQDILDGLQPCLEKIHRFLGVEPQPGVDTLIKQETRSMREIVENFDELDAHFRRTRWEHLIERHR